MALNFQRAPRPPNYLARGQQRRLLLMVMLLGLVVVLVFQARDPGNYEWLKSPPSAAGDGLSSLSVADGPNTDAGDSGQADLPDDTRLEPRITAADPEGTFLSIAPAALQAPEQASSRYFPGVNLEYLATVRDDRPFHMDEHQAWFHLFGVLGRTDQRTLEEHSTAAVTFVQLSRQPKLYRGELVSFRGQVRRATETKASKNEYGVDKFFRLWILMADNRRDPISVDVLELPHGFPLGDGIQEEVEVTGFFFKRRAYLGRDDIFTTPSLLARTVRWHERPHPPGAEPRLVQVLVIVAAAAALSLLTVWFASRRGGSQPPSRERRTSEADEVTFEMFDH